jgi:hypothetical protein
VAALAGRPRSQSLPVNEVSSSFCFIVVGINDICLVGRQEIDLSITSLAAPQLMYQPKKALKHYTLRRISSQDRGNTKTPRQCEAVTEELIRPLHEPQLNEPLISLSPGDAHGNMAWRVAINRRSRDYCHLLADSGIPSGDFEMIVSEEHRKNRL